MTRDCHILLLLILKLTHSLVRHPRKSYLVTMVMEEVLLTYKTFHAGEMFTFGNSQTPPYITYRVICKDGFMYDPVPITFEAPTRLEGCCTKVWCGLTWDAASDVLHLSSFFFFSQICADLAWFAPNRVDSARIGLYHPNWFILAGNRNRPKSNLNHAEIAEIGFEWGPNILNLSFLNFILNICFFFWVLLCFLLSSFFVLWTKAIVMCFLRIF